MTDLPLRLLIVDDDPVDRELYQRLLGQHSEYAYDFLEADLGEDGLALCRAESPDCILLDYRLPDLDGLEFLQALGSANGGVPFPAIMMTGGGNEMLVAEAMKAGAADYLPKSILSPESLGRAVANAVEKHKLRTAVEKQRQMLVKTNEELRHKNEEIQQFYRMLSHELKTPLTAAREFVSIVLDGLAGPLSDTQQEYLGLVKESCDQITLGLNDLLDVTRLDTGKLSISAHSVAIDAVVERAVASMTTPAQNKGIRLQQVIAPGLQEVCIDEQPITQVLNNLLGNAVKFTPEGGKIAVRVENDPERPGRLLVAVSVTGRGIALEQCDHIFDRFYQVREDDTAIEGGLGLGLHICQELVQLHGGEIWVESTLGKGSMFFFTLPSTDACAIPSIVREEVLT